MAKKWESRSSSKADVYKPRAAGEPVMDYDGSAEPVENPVEPEEEEEKPTGPVPPEGDVDPSAPSVLHLIGSTKFKEPFTVTLLRKTGTHVVRTDAGSKTEDSHSICQETVNEPADLLKLISGVAAGSYKLLNNNSLELQFLMFLAQRNGFLVSVGDVTPATE